MPFPCHKCDLWSFWAFIQSGKSKKRRGDKTFICFYFPDQDKIRIFADEFLTTILGKKPRPGNGPSSQRRTETVQEVAGNCGDRPPQTKAAKWQNVRKQTYIRRLSTLALDLRNLASFTYRQDKTAIDAPEMWWYSCPQSAIMVMTVSKTARRG